MDKSGEIVVRRSSYARTLCGSLASFAVKGFKDLNRKVRKGRAKVAKKSNVLMKTEGPLEKTTTEGTELHRGHTEELSSLQISLYLCELFF